MFCAAGLTCSCLQALFVIRNLSNRQLREGTFSGMTVLMIKDFLLSLAFLTNWCYRN